jgi:predicted nuclease of predicted toxin-antitoxin system
MNPIYCDESVWVPVAKGLRQRGWEVYTASEENNLGMSDKEQLEFAVRNGWVLLTFDDDFLALVERDDTEHSGIVYVNQSGKRVGDVVKDVDALLQDADSLEGIHYP